MSCIHAASQSSFAKVRLPSLQINVEMLHGIQHLTTSYSSVAPTHEPYEPQPTTIASSKLIPVRSSTHRPPPEVDEPEKTDRRPPVEAFGLGFQQQVDEPCLGIPQCCERGRWNEEAKLERKEVWE